MNEKKEAIKLIDRLYRDLYKSDEVIHHGTNNVNEKFKNLESYIDTLERTHNSKYINYLKKGYYDRYVIKRENVPESYYKMQQQIALDRGYGHIEITEGMKKEYQNIIIDDQKKRLDLWLDYLLSEDAKYPFWAKYWAFQGMLSLGKYDKKSGKYTKRTETTVEPFADLNREALAISIDSMQKILRKENLNDKELENIVKNGSFSKIYTYILSNILNNNKNIIKSDEGKWVKYDQGSDYMPLVKSLQGYNTGWCTAGQSTAKTQLALGDFYVYYTLNEKDEYKVPRIAIRMEENKIGEIRGIAEHQNMEPNMEKVVEEKIQEFPDRDEYKKKVNDMEMLTYIYI